MLVYDGPYHMYRCIRSIHMISMGQTMAIYLDLNIKQVNGKQLYLISLDLEQAFSARLVELNLSFSYSKVMTEQLTSIDRIDLDTY